MRQIDIRTGRPNQSTIKDGAFVALAPNVDDRGYLIEILRATDPYFTTFGQIYLVGNFARGVIRAFHKHRGLWDWFFVSHGAAKFVLVDDRQESPTYGQMNVFVTSGRNPALIAIPPG
ncbi:MAG: dTDP-4-dehydrorhamnose 3,5-epimerase family protein, partial [bacterium]